MHERLEKLQSHRLWQTTLVQLEIRTNHNHGTPRIIYTFTKQVLTETSLLAFEHIRNRFQRTVACTLNWTTAATVIEERIHSFLKHTLFVIHHNLRRIKINHALKTIIAVDNATIQIVEIGRCETTTVKLNHRTQIRRNHWKSIENHRFRLCTGVQECIHNFDSLESTRLALSSTSLDLFYEQIMLCLQIKIAQTALHSFCPTIRLEIITPSGVHFTIDVFITLQITDFERGELIPHIF
ncbi:Uncharacterised protein [Chlamydia trachomatis]|nr:Uncharacterised protein [Chlamydia trachomatis]